MEASHHKNEKPLRLRIFAGPNGSGKSTIINQIRSSNLFFGKYINADDINRLLLEN